MEYVQQVTGRVQAERIGDARALFDALEAHRRELSGQRGFLSMRIARSSEAGGDTLVSIETRWASQSNLTAYAEGARNAESILHEYDEMLVGGSVQERRAEAMETEAESKSRAQLDRFFTAAALPLVILGIGLAFIYSVSRIYLEMGAEGATVLSIVIASGIMLVAWYFAENEKAPTWQIAAVGTFAVVALIGGTVAAQVREGPDHGGENGENGEPPPPAGELLVELADNVFVFEGEDNPTIEVGANVPVRIRLDNVGTALHNMHIANPDFAESFCEAGGESPCSDPDQIDGGEEGVIEFTLPPGTYDYRCDFHVDEMAGTIEVVEGGPTGIPAEGPGGEPGGPGGEPGGPGGEPGAVTIDMDDNVFLVGDEENPELRAPADTEVTFTVVNIGAALHNMHIANPDFESSFCEVGERDPCSDPDQVQAGEDGTITFNLPAGEYEYRCDFHVDEMAGTLVVE